MRNLSIMRNSSIELLRLLCMWFIIMHHIIITVVAPNYSSPIYNFIDTIFHTAVVIFVIISGYFGIRLKVSKVIRFWGQVAYYSILIGIFAYFVLHSIGLKQLVDCAMPIYRRPYWFVSSYFELLLFSPALNILIDKLDRKHLIFSIIVLLFSNAVFPADLIYGSGLLLFSLLYLIGAYVARYKSNDYKNNRTLLVVLFIYMIIIFPLCHLSSDSYSFSSFLKIAYRYYGIGTIFLSLIIFLIFRNIQFYSSFVNYLARSVFAIYLIHENHLISYYMYQWPIMQLITRGLPSGISMLVVSLLLIIVCILIDQFRIYLFKVLAPLFNFIEVKIISSYRSVVAYLNLY